MRVLEIIINYLIITTVIFFFIKKYSLLPGYIKLVGYVLILNFFVEGVAAILLLNDENNLFLFHILNPVQFILFSYYLKAIISSKKARYIISYVIPLLVLVSLSISFTIQPFTEYNSYWLLIHNLLITIFVLYYFYEQSLEKAPENIYEKSILLINIGLFIYSVGSLLISGFLNHLIKYNIKVALYVHYGAVVISYLTYLFFLFAFIKIK